MGLSMYLTLNGGLRALLLGERKDVLFAVSLVLSGKMLLRSKDPFWYRLGLL